MSICRCCGLLPHPFRRLPSPAIRSFASTALVDSAKKLPAARDWGTKLKSESTGGGDLAGLSKWARRPEDPPRNRGGDRERWSGGGAGGSFGTRDRDRGDRGDRGSRGDKGDRGGGKAGGFGIREGGSGGGAGGWAKKSEAGGMPGMSRWAKPDDSRSSPSRNRDRRDGGTASGFGLRASSSGGDERGDAARSGREGSSSASRGPKDAGAATRRNATLDEPEVDLAPAASPSESPYDDADGYWEGGGTRSRRRHGGHVTREETDEGFAFVRGKQPKRNSPYDRPKEKPQSEHEKKVQHQAKEGQKKKKLQREEEKKVLIPSSVTVSRLASIFGRKLYNVQTRMQKMGLSSEKLRPDYILNEEEACDIALEFGFNPTVDDEAAFDLLPEPEKPGEVHPLRPPVVTIMGHVDHGKTTLLDALRNTAVAAGEAGGITQHIGAFSVPLKSLLPADAPPTDATITFLDTPGHAAFTEMRARGASVTDIVVLVVAADDGVMPQTKEVIELVKAEGDNVGLVVAINKIDKMGIDLERVRSELLAENVYLEEDGGDVQSVKVSGLSRIGLDDLVETLSTLAELRELRARKEGKAEGWVLESNVDKGIGRVATVLVTRGTLKPGAVVVAGHVMCKVRRMTDHMGNPVSSAGPGMPVVVTGWKGIPKAGDELLEAPNGEAEAKKVVANRIAQEERKKLLADTEVINAKRREDRDRLEAEHREEEEIRKAGGNVFEAKLAASRRAAAQARENAFKELRVVIKGDVSGTVEAVEGVLSGIGNKEAGVKVISAGVGELTESDIAMAEAAEALVIGFNVSASRAVKQAATQAKVELHLESVIYRLIETVRDKTAALLPPNIESRTIGEGTVIQNFTINVGKKQTVTIAGARCVNGTINRNDKIRILRGPTRTQVYEGTIVTLKHLKTEVGEVRKGMECGIQLDGFDGMQEGDEIVTFKTFEVPRKL